MHESKVYDLVGINAVNGAAVVAVKGGGDAPYGRAPLGECSCQE